MPTSPFSIQPADYARARRSQTRQPLVPVARRDPYAEEMERLEAESKAAAALQKQQAKQAEEQAEAERKAAEAQAKEQLRAENNAKEQAWRREKRPMYVDADGRLQSQFTDAEWKAQQGQQAKNDALRTQYFKEQRPWVQDAQGNIVPRHSDEEWQALKNEKAAKLEAAKVDKANEALRKERKLEITGAQRTLAGAEDAATLRAQELELQHSEAASKVASRKRFIDDTQKQIENDPGLSPERLQKMQDAIAAAQTDLEQWQAKADALDAEVRSQKAGVVAFKKAAQPVQAAWQAAEDAVPSLTVAPPVMGVNSPPKPGGVVSKPDAPQTPGLRDAVLSAFQASVASDPTLDTQQRQQAVKDIAERRDPVAYAASKRKRFAEADPDTLEQALTTEAKTIETRTADFNKRMQALNTATSTSGQALQNVLMRNKARMALPHRAADIKTVPGPDGQPISLMADMVPDYQTALGDLQTKQTALQAEADTLDVERDEIELDAQLHAEGVQALNAKREAEQAQRQAQAKLERTKVYDQFNSLPGGSKLGDKLRLIDETVEKHRGGDDAGLMKWANEEMQKVQQEADKAVAQGQKDMEALWQQFGYRRDAQDNPTGTIYRDWKARRSTDAEFDSAGGTSSIEANLDAEARRRGLDPEKVRDYMETRRRLDWGNALDPQTEGQQAELTRGLREKLGLTEKLDMVRKLPNGDIVPNPITGADKAEFEKVIEQAEGTPEQKAKAKTLWPEYRRLYGESAADVLEREPDLPGSFHDYREEMIRKSPGFVQLTRGEQAARYLDNAATRGGIQKWGQLIRRNVYAGFGDIATAVLGTAGAITGNETLSTLGADNARNMESLTAPQQFTGPKGVLADTAAQASRMLPGVAATIATGGMGGAMTFGGMQTGGLLYSDAYGKLREQGATHEQAWKATAPASVIAGAMTAALTKVFPGGATALNNAETRAAIGQAWKTFAAGAAASGRAIAKGALDEVPQEILDEGFSQLAQGYAEGRSPDEAVREFLTNLPELALASGLMGAGGEAMNTRFRANADGETLGQGDKENLARPPASGVSVEGVSGAVSTNEASPAPISTPARESALSNPDMGNAPAVEPATPQDRYTVARGALAAWDGGSMPADRAQATKDKAAVLVKIAEGAAPADLEQEELMAVGLRREDDGRITNGYLTNKGEWKKGVRPDGFTSVELIDGQFVVTDRQVERLRRVGLDAVADTFRKSAAERRKEIQDKETGRRGDKETPAAVVETKLAPNAGSSADQRPVQAPPQQGPQPPPSGSAPAQPRDAVASSEDEAIAGQMMPQNLPLEKREEFIKNRAAAAQRAAKQIKSGDEFTWMDEEWVVTESHGSAITLRRKSDNKEVFVEREKLALDFIVDRNGYIPLKRSTPDVDFPRPPVSPSQTSTKETTPALPAENKVIEPITGTVSPAQDAIPMEWADKPDGETVGQGVTAPAKVIEGASPDRQAKVEELKKAGGEVVVVENDAEAEALMGRPLVNKGRRGVTTRVNGKPTVILIRQNRKGDSRSVDALLDEELHHAAALLVLDESPDLAEQAEKEAVEMPASSFIHSDWDQLSNRGKVVEAAAAYASGKWVPGKKSRIRALVDAIAGKIAQALKIELNPAKVLAVDAIRRLAAEANAKLGNTTQNAVTPEFKQRVSEIAVELVKSGIPKDQALAVAGKAVEATGIDPDGYASQIMGDDFRAAMKAQGWTPNPANPTRWERADLNRARTGAEMQQQAAAMTKAEVVKKPANQTLRQGDREMRKPLIERGDWRKAKNDALTEGLRSMAGQPREETTKESKRQIDALNMVSDLVDGRFGALFDGVEIGNGITAGGYAAKAVEWDDKGRATKVVLQIDPLNILLHGDLFREGILKALDEEVKHRVDQMVSSRQEAIDLARATHAARPQVFATAWKKYFRIPIQKGTMPADPPAALSDNLAFQLYFETTRMIHQGVVTTEDVQETDATLDLHRKIWQYLKRWLTHVRREVRKLPKDLLGEWMARIEAAEKLLKKIEKRAIAIDKARLDDVEPPESAVRGQKPRAKSDPELDDELGAAADAYAEAQRKAQQAKNNPTRNADRLMNRVPGPRPGMTNIVSRLLSTGGITRPSAEWLKRKASEGQDRRKAGDWDWLDTSALGWWEKRLFPTGQGSQIDRALQELHEEGYFPEASTPGDVTGEMLRDQIAQAIDAYQRLRQGLPVTTQEAYDAYMSEQEREAREAGAADDIEARYKEELAELDRIAADENNERVAPGSLVRRMGEMRASGQYAGEFIDHLDLRYTLGAPVKRGGGEPLLFGDDFDLLSGDRVNRGLFEQAAGTPAAASAFTLEAVSAEQLDEEMQKAARKAKIAAKQAAPLQGSAGEYGTPDMLDITAGPMALFSQPVAQKNQLFAAPKRLLESTRAEPPPARPDLDDYLPSKTGKGKGSIKQAFDAYRADLTRWEAQFNVWAEKQGRLGVFTAQPVKSAQGPMYQRANVVTPMMGNAGWRMTVFGRYEPDGVTPMAGDWADGAWVPIGHDEFKTKPEAYEAALSGMRGAEFTTRALFAAAKRVQETGTLFGDDEMNFLGDRGTYGLFEQKKPATMTQPAPKEPLKAGGDFSLESVTGDQLDAEAEKRKTREEIQKRQDKPLIGTVGDIGQMDMLGGGDLFSLAAPVKRIVERTLPKLAALHNLSADNLAFADRLGGLAVPSIAVVPEGMGMSGFGEITLIGRRTLADPDENPVFDADAYTIRFPEPEYGKARSAEAQKLVNRLRPFADRFDDKSLIYEVWDNAVNRPAPDKSVNKMRSSMASKAAFLAEQGIEIAPVMRAKPLGAEWVTEPAMQKWQSRAVEVLNVGTDNTELLAEIGRDIRAAIDSYADKHLSDRPKDKLLQSLRGLWIKEYLDDKGMPLFGRLMRVGESLRSIGQQVIDLPETATQIDEAMEGREAAFAAWVDRQVLPMMGEPKLTLRGRKVPYTLGNIVEAMTSTRIKGREDTMTFGEGAARAAVSKRFGDLDTMRAAAADQIVPEQQVSEAREKAQKLLAAWREDVANYTTLTNWRSQKDIWGAMDASMKALTMWVKKGRTPAALSSALRSQGFAGVPAEVIQAGQAAAEAWFNAPVPYFESKPQRAVQLGEFAGAVIPESENDTATAEILNRRGIPFRTYPAGSRDVQAVVAAQFAKELAEKGESTLFAAPKRGGLPPAEVMMNGQKVTTGTPVTFQFLHNKESATKLFGKPNKDSDYDRGFEPSGRYVAETSDPQYLVDRFPNQYDTGTLTFQNPIVLPVGEYGTDSWKRLLSQAYGNLTGKRLSQALIADGHDGVITVASRGHSSEILDLTTFDVRKALYAAPKRTSEPPREVEPGFYSRLEQVIGEKMAGRASAKHIWGLVSNPQSGIKAEELKWSGLELWLAEQAARQGDKNLIAKADVLDYLRTQGAVRFEEVRLSDDKGFAIQPNESESDYAGHAIVDVIDPRNGFTRFSGTPSEARNWIDEENGALGKTPKFAQYTLPGGENYREVVVAMRINAEKSNGWQDYRDELHQRGFSPYEADEVRRWGVGAPAASVDQMAVAKVKETMGERWMNRYRDVLQSKERVAVKQVQYTSSHFPDVPNYLAHYRANDRVDAEGQRGTLLEELQSDRHQAGREQGYQVEEKPYTIRDNPRKGVWEVVNEKGESVGDYQSKQEAEAIVARSKIPTKGVPDAPYRSTWPLMLFKRALREAVETGKQWIGWTTGDTQFDRWGSERFDWKLRNEATERRAKTWIMSGQEQVGGNAGGVNIEQTARDRGQLLEEKGTLVSSYEDVLALVRRNLREGKAETIAEKLWKRMQTEPEGTSLPRREGMQAFYDSAGEFGGLVKEVNRYVKAWGAGVVKSSVAADGGMIQYRVKQVGLFWYAERNNSGSGWETMSMPYDTEQEARQAIEGPRTPIWRVDITPAMRESVKGGQMLFAAPKRQTGRMPDSEQAMLEHRLSTAKAEIEQDIASGQVPGTVRSWQDLQEHVDANEYVNDLEREDRMLGVWGRAHGWKQADYIAFTDKLIAAVDAWLKGGRADALREDFKLDNGVIQAYFDLPDVQVPVSKQPAATTAIQAALAPRGDKLRKAGGETGARERQERAARGYRGLIARSPEAVRQGLDEGKGRIGLLLHEFIRHEIPHFDIRGAVIKHPADFAAFNLAVRSPFFESVKLAVLGDGQQVIHSQILHVGALNESTLSPRMVAAVIDEARRANPKQKVFGVILGHNHPSGDPSPSDADNRITRRLAETLEMLGVPFNDHIITNGERYFSFRESGLMLNGAGWSKRKPKLPALPTPDRPSLGTRAEFEAMPRSLLLNADNPTIVKQHLDTLRTADPGQVHAVFLDTRLKIIAVHRIDQQGDVVRQILEAGAREGAKNVLLSFPNVTGAASEISDARRRMVRRVREMGAVSDIILADALQANTAGEQYSWKEYGLLEDSAEYGTPVDEAAHEAATSPQNDLAEPTEAQKDAGNYKKGHVRIAGHDISIENPAGSKRNPDWPVLQDHYGYFKGTNAKDGDHVDVFVKPGTPEDYAGPVHVVRQNKVETVRGGDKEKGRLQSTGEFDEYKVMLGYPTAEEARAAYLRNYEPGWPGLHKLSTHSMEEFGKIKAQVFTVPADRVPGVREVEKTLRQGDGETRRQPAITHTFADGYVLTGPGLHTLGAPAKRGITAYHGTPHQVDKFTTAKIGTGEGAQVYGWGLYFAESKAVAEEYRKMLSKGHFEGIQQNSDRQRAETWLNYRDKYPTDFNESMVDDSPDGRIIAGILAGQIRRSQGRIYTVELLPDESEFLDWDKPLSEQSEKVKQAIEKARLAMGDYSDWSKWTGMNMYAKMELFAKRQLGEFRPDAVSKSLMSVGIPGIRYLDQGSRRNQDAKAYPSSRFEGKWTVSHDKGIDYFDSEEAAQKAAEAINTPKTRNFVIFDENLVRILEENGKPVAGQTLSAPQKRPNPGAAPQGVTPAALPQDFARPDNALLRGMAVADWNRLDKAVKDQLARVIDPVMQKVKQGVTDAGELAVEFVTEQSLQGLEAAAGAEVAEKEKKQARERLKAQVRRAAAKVVRQVVPDAVVPADILAKRIEMNAAIALSQEKALDISKRALEGKTKLVDIMAGVKAEEFKSPDVRRKMYQAMNGKINSGVTMDDLTPEQRAVAEALKRAWWENGMRRVRNGTLRLDTFQDMAEGMPQYYEDDVNLEKGFIPRVMRMGLKGLIAQRSTRYHITDKTSKDKTGEDALVTWTDPQTKKADWKFKSKAHMDAALEDIIEGQILAAKDARAATSVKDLSADDVKNLRSFNWMTDTDRAALAGVTRDKLRQPNSLTPEQKAVVERMTEQLRRRFQKHVPLTFQQHEKRGLIMDPFYAISRALLESGHDNATAEFFNYIAKQADYIRDVQEAGFTAMPNDPRMGRLAGKWVRDDVAAELEQLMDTPNMVMRLYDWMLSLFKYGHTILNVGSHVRNVVGNIGFAQMAGSSPLNPGNWKAYGEAMKLLRDGGTAFESLHKLGILGGDYLTAEVRRALRQLMPDPDTVSRMIEAGDMSWLTGLKEQIARKLDKGGALLSTIPHGLEAAWKWEDDIYKVAAFVKARQMGQTEEEAAAHVRKWFPFYDKGTSGTLKALGRFVFPFLSFKRESLRIMGHALKERPLTFLTMMALPRALTQLSFTILEMQLIAGLAGLGDDDKEDLLKDMKGRAGGLLAPFMDAPLFSIALPYRDASGGMAQWDLSAVIPWSDWLSTRIEYGRELPWFQRVASQIVSGAPFASLLVETWANQDTFSGRRIWEDDMSSAEKLGNLASHTYMKLTPPMAGPHIASMMRAMEQQPSKLLPQRNPTQALMRILGIDIKPLAPDLYRKAEEYRKAQGAPVSPRGGQAFPKDAAARARARLYLELIQPQIDVEAANKEFDTLASLGEPVRTVKDLADLFKDRNAETIMPEKMRAGFVRSLPPESRRIYDAARAQQAGAFGRSQDVLRQRAQMRREAGGIK